MAKNYKKLQRISTIPILAALLIASNPSVVAGRQRPNNIRPIESSIEMPMDAGEISDTNLNSELN